MYKISANFYKDFFVYKDDVLIMVAKRKYNWFFGVKVKVFNFEDKLLIIYNSISFFFTKVKIKYQNLPDTIEIIGSIWKQPCIKVGSYSICNSLSSLPQRKMGKIKIDNKEVAKITNKKIFRSSLEFEIDFMEENEYEIYCIILFLMNISAIESF